MAQQGNIPMPILVIA